LKEIIYKYALKNALDYGKADSKAVLGKVLAELPELKSRIKELLPQVEDIVKEVNSLSIKEREKNIKKYEFSVKEKREKTLPPLSKTKNVVLRFAPNPSGPLHLGHSRAAVLNDEYAKRYNGKLILRFEDTDPTRVDLDAYDMIKQDLEWLGVTTHKTVIQSDRLEIYYRYAEKLIKKGHAYVCTCNPKEFQKLRVLKRICNCRNNEIELNLERFEKMFTAYGEGEAVVRLKTDMNLADPSMREFPIMRISGFPHPRVGDCRVYPLMNFSVTIDDHLDGLTHVLRGKDHIANTEKQKFIYKYLGWTPPEFIHYGRLKIEGVALSTSDIREGIKKGEYSGWDDIKLGTLKALKRRGIQPEAVRQAMIDIGVKMADINFSWENLYAFNRSFIDAKSNRYFFVFNPKELIVKGCKGKKVKAPLHPDYPDRGSRVISITSEQGECRLYITKQDFDNLKEGNTVRLMEAFNIEICSKKDKIISKFVSEELEYAREIKAKLIHWVPVKENIAVKVISPNGVIGGVGEISLTDVNIDDIVQFERFGYVRIDSKDGEIVSYFTHK